MSTPVVVVGCGIIGASIAWRLAQRGATVTCLDARPGDGATYAAAGMLAAVTEADFGERDRTMLGTASARLWPDFAADLEASSGRPVGLRRCGTLTVAYDHGDRAQLGRLADLQRSWGLRAEDVSVADARTKEPLLGPRIAGVSWAPDDQEVDPREVHAALMTALDRNGVWVVKRSARSLIIDHGAADGGVVAGVVDDEGDEHLAGSVVLAAGWQSGELVHDLSGVEVPTRPVKGQILRLDASGQHGFRLSRIVRGIVQSRSIYIVPRTNGEIVVGSTSEEQPDDRVLTAGGVFTLLRDARAIIPGLDELPLADITARARPGSPDNLPMIGESGTPGLLLATGHYRNGILLAPLTADAIVARLTGGPVPNEVVAADPRRFSTTPPLEVGI